MSSAMELNQDTLQQIGEYVKKHLPEWQREWSVAAGDASGNAGIDVSAAYVHRTIDLGERIVRVEEELKTQRDLIREGFAESARRFEEQTAVFNTRFEEQTAVFNTRFEEQTANFNTRFEEQTANFNTRFEDFNRRFEEQAANVNKRFDDVNKRFEDVNRRFDDVNKRFDDVNRRFEDMQKHTNRWMMLISLFLAVIGAMPWIMGAY